MRQLLPTPIDEVDPFEAHAAASRAAHAARPWVALNMVVSVDGATALHGVSGGLGGHADHDTFRAIRAIADVILVAAGTVRAEAYGPPKTAEVLQRQRVARGQALFPTIAIVSGSLDLALDTPVFSVPERRPMILTGDDAPAASAELLGPVADVHRLGPSPVAAEAIVGLLHRQGHRVVVCEGGPSLNAQLLAAGLVDELNVTTSALLVGGPSPRLAWGALAAPQGLRLAHLWHDPDDDALLARYVRDTPS